MATPAKTVTKGSSFKNTLDLPFKLHWPNVTRIVASQIISELESSLQGLEIVAKKKQKRKKVEVDSKMDIEHVPKRPQLDTDKLTPSSVEEEKTPLSPSEAAAKRSQVVIGVNEVTKSLERGTLRAIVVCMSVRIPLLHEHIQLLSATRDVPCVGLHRMSKTIAPTLGLKSATAIGLKKLSDTASIDYFSKLVNLIANQVPKICIPWLHPGKRKGNYSTIDPLNATIQNESEPTSKGNEGICENLTTDSPNAVTKIESAANEVITSGGKLEENEETNSSQSKEDLELQRKPKPQTETQTKMSPPQINYFPATIKKTITTPKRKRRRKQ